MEVIKVKNLTKIFKRQRKLPGFMNTLKSIFSRETVMTVAVDKVCFSIEQGEIVGFLGPNGAGKTTTLKMLAGILFPSSGEAEVLGYVPWERKEDFKKKIGMVMGQKQQLLWDLPAADSFELFKEIYGLKDEEYKEHLGKLVSLLEVEDIMNVQVRQLSLGQRMKMEIIAALLHKPVVLFLDEPTIGLDVVSQKNIRDFFREYNKENGTTIILTSHYMQDIKELCERVIIINNGSIIYDDPLQKLMSGKTNSKIITAILKEEIKAGTDFGKYGELIEAKGKNLKIATSSENVVETTSKMIADLGVEDISIADPEADDVIRELFNNAK